MALEMPGIEADGASFGCMIDHFGLTAQRERTLTSHTGLQTGNRPRSVKRG